MTTLTTRQQKAIEWNKDFYTSQAEGKHGQRWINNRVNKVVEEMELIANSFDIIEEVKIKVEWKRSSTWGMNPMATIEVFGKGENGNSYRLEYIGSASGCGYDKESAAVAEAMNQCKALLKRAYKTLEENKAEKPYGLNDYENGVSFARGVGMSCYRNIANYLGFEWSEEHGKSWDFYSMKSN